MNIGIIDADLLDNGTRHPNLALMKISGYMKEMGHDTSLLLNYNDVYNYEKIYMSKVFSFTDVPLDYRQFPDIEYGGTGFFEDGGENLPQDIEHHMPDYQLYDPYIAAKVAQGAKPNTYSDYVDYSIGFTTRGCFRKCDFCVNKKYNHVFRHSPLTEFLDKNRKYIYLWDDNIMGYNKWHEVFDELEATGKYFQFRQGLDIRLMTDEKAKRLKTLKYKGDFIFAFDHIQDKELIQSKLKLWRKHINKTTKLYVLCSFDSTNTYDETFWVSDIINTFERIKILMQFGCLPYIMRYERYKTSPYRGMYINLGRWCNQPNIFKKMSFNNFVDRNQELAKTPRPCSAKRYADSFRLRYPNVAQKYYDLRFEDLNQYK
ncbi:hypothetical protein [Vallitalea guaymasensis]|uniref:Radical SAM core domain-containing protein n=1 Tax=Vallitalea guaymasensis TaxID=1185412 RepID=A0A8J8M8M7_9FIRM|nr:hypothetical protein [Vallitalea guaymasensis]QUH28304.1 hypothetical protein HYG85_04975 [Vallitalea guaymasensis]